MEISVKLIDARESLMALDIDLAVPIYEEGGFTLLAGVGFSYLPNQTLFDGTPFSGSQALTTTTYAHQGGGLLDQYMNGAGDYVGNDPTGGYVGVPVKPHEVSSTQTIMGHRLSSDLEASELRLMLQPEYVWSRVTLGLRTGVALGYASNETSASLSTTFEGNTQPYSFEASEDKVYAQLLLGLSLSFVCTDTLSLSAWADARLGGSTLKTETGPYQTEVDLDHYSIGLALEYRF